MSLPIKDGYANVFEIVDKGNFVTCRLSSSRKDKEGKLVNSSWDAIFVNTQSDQGNVDKAKTLVSANRIKFNGSIEKRKYVDKDGKNQYPSNVTIYSFELLVHKDKSDDDLPY